MGLLHIGIDCFVEVQAGDSEILKKVVVRFFFMGSDNAARPWQGERYIFYCRHGLAALSGRFSL